MSRKEAIYVTSLPLYNTQLRLDLPAKTAAFYQMRATSAYEMIATASKIHCNPMRLRMSTPPKRSLDT
jgi:hypothetical protein